MERAAVKKAETKVGKEACLAKRAAKAKMIVDLGGKEEVIKEIGRTAIPRVEKEKARIGMLHPMVDMDLVRVAGVRGATLARAVAMLWILCLQTIAA